jgi:hypothetical protein
MRRLLTLILPWTAFLALLLLCSCSWQSYYPPADPSLPNAVAIDRALHVCSLTQGEQPFHLVLSIAPPEHATTDMSAQVELFWLNAVTYRIVIRSRDFSQVRIVNGSVVEEHDNGAFYPRWIQNFVDALLNPVPSLAALRKVPGTLPIGTAAHACISAADPALTTISDDPSTEQDPARVARICFQDADPKIVSTLSFSRSIWFDDFAPFGPQLVPYTLVNALPANLQIRGHIIRLERLAKADERLLKAHEFTQPARQILTKLVSESSVRSLLVYPENASLTVPLANESITIYVRTDRNGHVREAYRASSDNGADLYVAQDSVVRRALTYQFKPLVIDGIPFQMEAPLRLSSKFTMH